MPRAPMAGLVVILPQLLILVALGACEETENATEARETHGGATEPSPPLFPPPRDPGPQVWRPRSDGPSGGDGEGGAVAGGEREREPRARAAKRLTKAEIRARFASLGAIDDEAEACQQAFLAFRETRDGMGELLGADRMGGPNRADYVALCRAFPAEVQRCLTPSYQATNQEDCRGTLARFGRDREDPAWLERFTGHPASERPEPATSEEEGRAINRRRRGRMNGEPPAD